MALVSEGATWSFGVNEEFFGLDDKRRKGLRFVTILITPLDESIKVNIHGISAELKLNQSYSTPLKLEQVSSESDGSFNLLLNGEFLATTNFPLHQSGNMRVTVKGLHKVENPCCTYKY